MERNKNLVVNIPADGIQAAVVEDITKTEAEYRELAEKYVSVYLKNTSVGRMLFNVCYKRAVTDSNVADSVLYNIELGEDGKAIKDENGNSVKTISQAAEKTNMLNNFRTMIKRNIDVIEMLIDSTKVYGAEAWLSVRMNDHHFPDDIGFNSTLSHDRANVVGVNGSQMYMNHTVKVVQNYYKAYICELCEKYDIDGIELDFLRSAPVMSEVNEENIANLTNYIKDIRKKVNEMAEKKNRKIQLSARVYSTPEHNLSFGMDPAQWIADGSIDILAVEGWYIPTYYNIPIEEWRKNIDEKNIAGNKYTLLGGTDWAVRCDSTAKSGYIMWITLEQLKGFASAMFNKGADGIYFFNHFSPDGNGAWTYYVDENGVKIAKNILKDKLLAADSKAFSEKGVRTYVNTERDYSNTLYPVLVTDNVRYTAVMNTGTKPVNGHYTVIIGIDANEGYEENNLEVFINGTKLKQITDVQKATGFLWTKGQRCEPVADHVSETAARVMRFGVEDLSIIQDGDNNITIANKNAEKPQSVKWLEIQVQETE